MHTYVLAVVLILALLVLYTTPAVVLEGYTKKRKRKHKKSKKNKKRKIKKNKKFNKRRYKFPHPNSVKLAYNKTRKLSKREKKVITITALDDDVSNTGSNGVDDSAMVADVIQSKTASVLDMFNPGVYDQGALGNCVINALCMAWRFAFWHVSGGTDLDISRLQLYHDARLLQCTDNCDLSGMVGALPGDAIKCLQDTGFVEDAMWPQTNLDDDETSGYTQNPPDGATEAALSNRNRYIASYYNALGELQSALVVEMVQSVAGVKQCIQEGYPVVFSVYTSTWDDIGEDGLITPTTFENANGGHCMLIVGYNDAAQYFIVQNSWSTDWGINGLGIMKYDDWDNVVDKIGWRIHLFG